MLKYYVKIIILNVLNLKTLNFIAILKWLIQIKGMHKKRKENVFLIFVMLLSYMCVLSKLLFNEVFGEGGRSR